MQKNAEKNLQETEIVVPLQSRYETTGIKFLNSSVG